MMPSRVWTVAAALLILTMQGAPTLAQLAPETQTGSRIATKPIDIASKRTAEVVKGMSQCIHRTNRPLVQRLLRNSDPESIDFARIGTSQRMIVHDLRIEDCLEEVSESTQATIGLTTPLILIRFWLIEEDYLANVKSLADLAPLPAVSRVFVSQGESLARAQAVGNFADCIAATDAEASDALLRTLPGTDAEKRQARALAPVLGRCLVQGQQMVLTPASIRRYAAEGLWSRFVRPLSAEPAAAGAP